MKVGVTILHFGLSFSPVSSVLPLNSQPSQGHTLNPLVQYLVFPIAGACALLLVQKGTAKVSKTVDERSLEQKSSKELVLAMAQKLLPGKPDVMGHTPKGWIMEMDERMDRVEENQRRYMGANGVQPIEEDDDNAGVR
jgi:hypothetical protein